MVSRLTLLSMAACTFAAACSDTGKGASGTGGNPPARTPEAADAGAEAVPSFRGTVPMKVSVEVGGSTYRAQGEGECGTSADASIYGAPATQWTARLDGEDGSDLSSVNVTVWRLRSGGAHQASVSILIEGEDPHQIATVEGGEVVGRGKAAVRQSSRGGALTFSGEDGHGDAVQLSVDCERFDEIVAEGG